MTGRRPAYSVTLWVAPQWRERHPELPLSLTEALASGELHAEPDAQAELPELDEHLQPLVELDAAVEAYAEPEAVEAYAESAAEAEI